MADKRDYYEVLDIPKDADDRQIKKSYRTLAKKYHPDLNKDDQGTAEERFKEIAEAYEVLADGAKRSRYDRYGHAGVSEQFGTGGFEWQNFSHMDDLSDMFGGSIFDRFFGGGQGRQRRGSDLRGTIELDLEDAAKGLTKRLDLTKSVSCAKCRGTGGDTKTCGTCNGQGQVRQIRRMGPAQFINIGECPECRGQGRQIIKACPVCKGAGSQPKSVKLDLAVPAGVEDGMTMRMGGQGEAGPPGGQPGDLLIHIRVRPHDIFERDGQNLLVELPISITVAALGGVLKVPTLEGKVEIDIPTGTQSGKTFRLRGKGLPHPNYRGKGDLYARVQVVIPSKLSKEKKAAFKALGEVMGDYTAKPRKRGWWDRLVG